MCNLCVNNKSAAWPVRRREIRVGDAPPAVISGRLILISSSVLSIKIVTRLFPFFRSGTCRARRGVPYEKIGWKNETITFVFSETFTLCARVCNVIVIIIIIVV